jgi:hypothetical protein
MMICQMRRYIERFTPMPKKHGLYQEKTNETGDSQGQFGIIIHVDFDESHKVINAFREQRGPAAIALVAGGGVEHFHFQGMEMAVITVFGVFGHVFGYRCGRHCHGWMILVYVSKS